MAALTGICVTVNEIAGATHAVQLPPGSQTGAGLADAVHLQLGYPKEDIELTLAGAPLGAAHVVQPNATFQLVLNASVQVHAKALGVEMAQNGTTFPDGGVLNSYQQLVEIERQVETIRLEAEAKAKAEARAKAEADERARNRNRGLLCNSCGTRTQFIHNYMAEGRVRGERWEGVTCRNRNCGRFIPKNRLQAGACVSAPLGFI